MTDIEEFINEFTVVAIAIGSVLGYLVKLRWSREFEKTMDARVAAAEEAKATLLETWQERIAAVQEAMKAQLEAANQRFLSAEEKAKTLMMLSPENTASHFDSLKSHYEGLIKNLKSRLDEAEEHIKRLSGEAAEERTLRERLDKEKKSFEEEASFLKAQIEDLKERERVLKESIELLRKKPFQEDMVKQQLRRFSAERTVAKVKYESAQQGVHASVAAYMNAQATARVDAEKREERKLAMTAPIPANDDRDT